MLKRSLILFVLSPVGCTTTTKDGIESITAGDGVTFSHEFRNGVPFGAGNDTAETFVGLVSDQGRSSWMFQLKFKNGSEKDIKSIFVYDVSGKPQLLVSDKKPKVDESNHFWTEIKETDASWLDSDQDSFFIFKFLIVKKDGSKDRLYQPQNFTVQNKKQTRIMMQVSRK